MAQVFSALSQLECDSIVWENILLQSFELLNDSNDENLMATIHFIFRTASQYQQLPEAVSILCLSFLSLLRSIYIPNLG